MDLDLWAWSLGLLIGRREFRHGDEHEHRGHDDLGDEVVMMDEAAACYEASGLVL